MSKNVTQETLALVKTAQQNPITDGIQKAFTQATGLVAYDLEPAAKLLYPVLTPLRNKIPRVSGKGGTATNWKQITGVNAGNVRPGVSEGQRGGVIATTVVDKVAAYKGLGLEDSVSFEADYAAEGFDDAKARAVEGLLNATMIQEERVILGGNASLALGTTPTPTLVGSTTGGLLAAATYSVICVALSFVAMREATVSGGVSVGGTRTNADGSTDVVNGGYGAKSTNATVATTGSTGSITATVAPVNGACGYAWYWGAAGAEVLGAVTYLNSVLITATATGTQAATALLAGDKSQDSLVFDGLLTQLFASGSGAYVQALPTGVAGTGTALTSDGAGGINEVDTAFSSFWDNYRLSPDQMYMSARTLLSMNKLVLANGGAPLIRFSMDSGGSQINAGTVIGTYLNKITNKQVKIEVHPDMPNGMILFYSNSIPYPLANVQNILQIKSRREYYQVEWPLRTRKYEYGVYADELLQNYFPPAFGVLRNIAVG